MSKKRTAKIQIQIGTARRGVPHSIKLRAWARAAMRTRDQQLCIRIVGNAESRKLNNHWRGKDKPTNVLSFPYSDPQAPGPKPQVQLLGDLALCAPVIAREAREQSKSISAHWAHMVVHGVLHLLGYDHIKVSEAHRMEALEVRILAQLGYADPYRSLA